MLGPLATTAWEYVEKGPNHAVALVFLGGLRQVAKEVANYSDFDLHQICSGFDSLSHLCLPEEVLFTSAKMERLRTLLPDLVAKGHRILLFSQWTRLLDLLEVWRCCCCLLFVFCLGGDALSISYAGSV